MDGQTVVAVIAAAIALVAMLVTLWQAVIATGARSDARREAASQRAAQHIQAVFDVTGWARETVEASRATLIALANSAEYPSLAGTVLRDDPYLETLVKVKTSLVPLLANPPADEALHNALNQFTDAHQVLYPVLTQIVSKAQTGELRVNDPAMTEANAAWEQLAERTHELERVAIAFMHATGMKTMENTLRNE